MDFLRSIIKTLNLIEVKGADNMDRMLACIQGLERLDKAMEEQHHDDNNEQKQDVPGAVD